MEDQHTHTLIYKTPVSVPICPDYLLKSLRAAQVLAQHSWEFATAAHATLEYHNPELCAYGPLLRKRESFTPNLHAGGRPLEEVPALQYIKQYISDDKSELQSSPFAIGDPPSLIPFALLLARTSEEEIVSRYFAAVDRQIDVILHHGPKHPNGAISHWRRQAELWSDFVHMTPPSIAEWALRTHNSHFIHESVQQIRLYHEILAVKPGKTSLPLPSRAHGLWRHIFVSPGNDKKNQDLGLWTTGNGWVGLGICRTWAILLQWLEVLPDQRQDSEAANNLSKTWSEIFDLKSWVKELIDGVIRVDSNHEPSEASESNDDCPLLHNYLSDQSYFRECAGTAALVATVFRYYLLLFASLRRNARLAEPGETDEYRERHLLWARSKRLAVHGHIDQRSGVAAPSVWPLDHFDRNPCFSGSSEGQSFIILMETAWRDWNESGFSHNVT